MRRTLGGVPGLIETPERTRAVRVHPETCAGERPLVHEGEPDAPVVPNHKRATKRSIRTSQEETAGLEQVVSAPRDTAEQCGGTDAGEAEGDDPRSTDLTFQTPDAPGEAALVCKRARHGNFLPEQPRFQPSRCDPKDRPGPDERTFCRPNGRPRCNHVNRRPERWFYPDVANGLRGACRPARR